MKNLKLIASEELKVGELCVIDMANGMIRRAGQNDIQPFTIPKDMKEGEVIEYNLAGELIK